MPTVFFAQGWRSYFHSNEGNELMHVHAAKGEAECKCWLHSDRLAIAEFAHNMTPRLRREIRQVILEHFGVFDAGFDKSFSRMSLRPLRHPITTLEKPVKLETEPVLAKQIETTPEALIVTTETGSVSIPWQRCSKSLAKASWPERSRADLSPSGYGIHWPLLDEDLAVGPLLHSAA